MWIEFVVIGLLLCYTACDRVIIFLFCFCVLFGRCLVVSTSAIERLERLVAENDLSCVEWDVE